MEALLLTIEFALMTLLVITLVRRDRSERAGRNLGFFRYQVEAPRRARDGAAGKPGKGRHA